MRRGLCKPAQRLSLAAGGTDGRQGKRQGGRPAGRGGRDAGRSADERGLRAGDTQGARRPGAALIQGPSGREGGHTLLSGTPNRNPTASIRETSRRSASES